MLGLGHGARPAETTEKPEADERHSVQPEHDPATVGPQPPDKGAVTGLCSHESELEGTVADRQDFVFRPPGSVIEFQDAAASKSGFPYRPQKQLVRFDVSLVIWRAV